MKPNLLEVQDLHAHYGKSHILQGVSLSVQPGEVVALLGRNGSGRSTTLKALMGLVPPSSGSVCLDQEELVGRKPYHVARAGLAYVPEERLVFANLTVRENLRIGLQPAHSGYAQWSVERMFEFFPRLRERLDTKAGSLSGGEQQMLTICRSLLGNPKLILIDEPTEGLAPKIVQVVAEVIEEIRRAGVAVLLVEQKLTIALKVARRVLVMGHGRIVFEGGPEEVSSDSPVMREWLTV